MVGVRSHPDAGSKRPMTDGRNRNTPVSRPSHSTHSQPCIATGIAPRGHGMRLAVLRGVAQSPGDIDSWIEVVGPPRHAGFMVQSSRHLPITPWALGLAAIMAIGCGTGTPQQACDSGTQESCACIGGGAAGRGCSDTERGPEEGDAHAERDVFEGSEGDVTGEGAVPGDVASEGEVTGFVDAGSDRDVLAVDPWEPDDGARSDTEGDAGPGEIADGGSGELPNGGGDDPDGATPTEWDLDSDGVMDTDLAIGICVGSGGGTCLVISSNLTSVVEVPIADLGDGCLLGVFGSSTGGSEIRLTGDHGGDGISEVTTVHCPGDALVSRVTISVVDITTGELSGQAAAPDGAPHVHVLHPQGPNGLRHPVLAPGYGDGHYGPPWARLCVYRPQLASDPECGPGFSSIEIPGPPATFREAGGLVQDVDGDGWEDVHLIYHGMVWYGSIQSLASIASVEFDVALATEPASPPLFHSGRNYGSHRGFVSGEGEPRTLIVGGAPLGSFEDTNCNVSRFVAMLAQDGMVPETRHLAWSRYYGFASTIFDTYDPFYDTNPAGDVVRPADVMDGCVHRFSDSLTIMEGVPAVLINYFDQQAPHDLCLEEQWALYQVPVWTDAKADAWYSCFAANVASSGVWGMQLLRVSDGHPLTGGQGHYVWGWSDALLPGGEVVYLLEMLPGEGRFDLADRAPSPLQAFALVNGIWSSRGVFPVEGRPLMKSTQAIDSLGVGSMTYISELTVADADGDGIQEVALEDGSWIEWSLGADAFVTQ